MVLYFTLSNDNNNSNNNGNKSVVSAIVVTIDVRLSVYTSTLDIREQQSVSCGGLVPLDIPMDGQM